MIILGLSPILLFTATILHQTFGDTAFPRQFPYVVKIFYTALKPEHKPIRCTGSVYNENWIITSTACALPTLNRMKGQPTHDYVDFWYGSEVTNRNCKPNDTNFVRYGEEGVVPGDVEFWENGTIKTGEDSIALLKTNKPLIFPPINQRSQLAAIQIPEQEKDCLSELKPTMFGAWEERTRHGKGLLHQINLKKRSDDVCKVTFPGLDPDKKLCATLTNTEDFSCYPDSGGPYVRTIKRILPQSPVPVYHALQCGVLPTTSCDRNDDKTSVDYYIRVSTYRQWILDTAGPQNPDHFIPPA